MKEFMKKVALLLICMPSSMMVALLTSSLIYIYQDYANYSESVVTMILTIPNLTVMIGLILAPVLVKKIPIKHLILAGLGIEEAQLIPQFSCVRCSDTGFLPGGVACNCYKPN